MITSRPHAGLWIVALVVVVPFTFALALMNLTPGHLGFPDNDGCACFVTYTTHPSLAACEETRPIHCDYLWSQQLLAQLSRFDLTK